MANAAQASGARRWSAGIYGLVVVILAAAAYEAAFALQIIQLPAGAQSGEAPRFETHIVEVATIAIWVGAIACLAASVWPRLTRQVAQIRAVWVLPAACAALVIARLFTFDPYYAPNLHRAGSEGLELWWVVFGVVVTGLVQRLGSRRLRAALLTTAATLIYAAASVIIIRGFH